jgi:hypothetical protein
MGSATCSACGARYAFDPDRDPGRLVVRRDGAEVVVCFPACPSCGKKNTAEVAPGRPPGD